MNGRAIQGQLTASVAAATVVMAGLSLAWEPAPGQKAKQAPADQSQAAGPSQAGAETAEGKRPTSETPVTPGKIAPFVKKGIEWLVAAQHPNGGWGAGSHAEQQNRDPHEVKVDPATTAFTGMALLRAGHTPVSGQYKDAVRKATVYLVRVVENHTESGPRITDLTGTQPQTKLGPLVDTSMTSQYLARVLTTLPEDDPLRSRVDAALETCLAKLQESQQKDGSWNLAGGGGWAPVLQSALGCNALEVAQAAGKKVDIDALNGARNYQKGNFDRKTGRVDASKAAGVALYAYSGSQRANAGEARAANDLVAKAKKEGRLADDAEVSESNLKAIGVDSETANRLANANSDFTEQNKQLADENLLRGFGSNGGEEYLSYLMTSESLVIAGGTKWQEWNEKMHTRLAKVQSPDGSWTGHHCITSPVFCTAAVVQCLTADRDAKLLIQIARNSAKTGAGDSGGTPTGPKPEEPDSP